MLLVASSGCAICNSEYDFDYSAFGGSWDRHDRTHGRVGSAFHPAGERVSLGKTSPAEEQKEESPSNESLLAPETPSEEEMTEPAPDESTPPATDAPQK